MGDMDDLALAADACRVVRLADGRTVLVCDLAKLDAATALLAGQAAAGADAAAPPGEPTGSPTTGG